MFDLFGVLRFIGLSWSGIIIEVYASSIGAASSFMCANVIATTHFCQVVLCFSSVLTFDKAVSCLLHQASRMKSVQHAARDREHLIF